MKYITFSMIVAAFICLSCPHVERDPIGQSDFVIQNKSNQIIYYDGTFTDEYPNLTDIHGSVDKHDKRVVKSNVKGWIGMHAKPAEVFESIRIFSDEANSHEIYVQDPVYDSLWLHETPSGYYYWSYAIYTLEIFE
jgi:hypothetical protein